MSEITRKLAIFSCLLLTRFCFLKAAPGLVGGADGSMLPSAQAALSPAVTPPRAITTPIQEMRVVGRNPIRIQTEATIDPTPEGWRLVSVRMLKPDGTDFEAELLRPLSWIHRHRARPGAVIQLNMPELHVVGAAEVLSISACPPIDPGDGPVVLSTFKNIAKNILNIYVEGETDPIGVTAVHPIWSEDRQAFVHSDQLQPGERLRSALGKTVRITSIEIRAGPEPVYNLEVAGEHVYSVTDSGLLVHNTGPCDPDLYVFDKGSRSARLISSSDINTPRVATRSSDEFLQELFDANTYTVRVSGKHHLTPRALGNKLPYGHKSLTDLKSFKHTVLQGELDNHLRSITKTLDDGTVVDLLPRRGNSGAVVLKNFSLDERTKAVDEFYRTFLDGRFYPAYRMELNAAIKAGKLK